MSPLRWDVLLLGFVLALPVLAMGLRGDLTTEEVALRVPWCLAAAWGAVAVLRYAGTPRTTGERPSRKRHRFATSPRYAGSTGSTGISASIRAMISRAGMTSSKRQPFVVPTSMYSMKRTMTPVPLNRRTRSTIPSSLTSRRTTAFTFTGDSPASRAASMPSTRSRTIARAMTMPAQPLAACTKRRTIMASTLGACAQAMEAAT